MALYIVVLLDESVELAVSRVVAEVEVIISLEESVLRAYLHTSLGVENVRFVLFVVAHVKVLAVGEAAETLESIFFHRELGVLALIKASGADV